MYKARPSFWSRFSHERTLYLIYNENINKGKEMFIVEKPFASELLIDTILKHDWIVLDNEVIRSAGIEEGEMKFVSSDVAKSYYQKQEYPLIYSNSENAISWVVENLPDSKLASYINLFKNKIEFRNLLKNIYPDYYYLPIDLENARQLQPEEIKYPVVIKPAVGFLSVGVHTVYDANEWQKVITSLETEMDKATFMYPKTVVSDSQYIIEELIQGEEFAIDAYYDRNGEPVILNIFQHPFYDKNDVSDRIYITSASIMLKHMAKFGILLKQIGDLADIRNFPLHMEVRVTEEGQVIPIEINPMRFAGWCTTDVAKYAWKINVYEYFYFQKRPDWNKIFSEAGSDIFYFSMAEVPSDIKKVEGFNYGKFLNNYSNILELRRINFTENPLFAVIFGSTTNENEIKKIMSLKTKDFIL